jgi:hypothetical protein
LEELFDAVEEDHFLGTFFEVLPYLP